MAGTDPPSGPRRPLEETPFPIAVVLKPGSRFLFLFGRRSVRNWLLFPSLLLFLCPELATKGRKKSPSSSFSLSLSCVLPSWSSSAFAQLQPFFCPLSQPPPPAAAVASARVFFGSCCCYKEKKPFSFLPFPGRRLVHFHCAGLLGSVCRRHM